MKILVIFLTFFLCLYPSACASPTPQEAQDQIDKFFEAVKLKDYSGALTYFAPEYFEITSQDEALRELNDVESRWGGLLEWKLNERHSRKIVSTSGSYILYWFGYDTKYEHYDTKEVITLVKTGAEPKIISRMIVDIESLIKAN